MLRLLERVFGLQGTPEMHVPIKESAELQKKHSSLSAILNRLSSFLVTKIRCNILKENCLSLLLEERQGIFLNNFCHLHSISGYCLAQDFMAVGVTSAFS